MAELWSYRFSYSYGYPYPPNMNTSPWISSMETPSSPFGIGGPNVRKKREMKNNALSC